MNTGLSTYHSLHCLRVKQRTLNHLWRGKRDACNLERSENNYLVEEEAQVCTGKTELVTQVILGHIIGQVG